MLELSFTFFFSRKFRFDTKEWKSAYVRIGAYCPMLTIGRIFGEPFFTIIFRSIAVATQLHKTDATPEHRWPNGELITAVLFLRGTFNTSKNSENPYNSRKSVLGTSFLLVHAPSHWRVNVYIPISRACLLRVPDTRRRRVIIRFTRRIRNVVWVGGEGRALRLFSRFSPNDRDTCEN